MEGGSGGGGDDWESDEQWVNIVCGSWCWETDNEESVTERVTG
jgi:hypothetical protein